MTVIAPLPPHDHGPRSSRGQSMVEFILVLPILLILFLGIADFGRVFHAGIVIEAAARNAAEIVAEEYRRNPPGGSLTDPPPPGDAAFYQPLHDLAGRTVCSEARTLTNTTYDPVTRNCHVADGDPATPNWMPIVMACIHDGEDPLCATPVFGASVPTQCSGLTASIAPDMDAGEASRFVEVRVCYQFSTLIHVPIFSLGDVWLQKDRAFTVANYPVPTPSIPPEPSAPPPTDLPSEEPSPSESASESPAESASESPADSPGESPAESPPPVPSDTPAPSPEPTPSPTPTPPASEEAQP
jgi:hypothetical protein